jgi:prepilin-type N-terminal cleavage/methylation domain-containing protein
MSAAMNAHARPSRSRHAGFSLVEIAIVLAIVALLMAGLLPTLSSQVEQRHISDTRKQLDNIQQALLGYAVINGRLPCPADGTVASGQAGAGLEATTGSGSAMTCAYAGGVLPWATLGLDETDAWGRRFSYRVTTAFADGADGAGGSCPVTSGVSFQLCSVGNLNVLAAAGGGTIAGNVPAIVVSHGINGYGAYTPAGRQLSGASGDEGENADANNTFVSHDFTPTFDDLVTWISPNVLMNRMVAAGKLP